MPESDPNLPPSDINDWWREQGWEKEELPRPGLAPMGGGVSINGTVDWDFDNDELYY